MLFIIANAVRYLNLAITFFLPVNNFVVLIFLLNKYSGKCYIQHFISN